MSFLSADSTIITADTTLHTADESYTQGAGYGSPRIPCPSSVEAFRRACVNLLPPGYAWRAADEPGRVMYHYWRAVARTMKWFTDQCCQMIDEFFCSTRNILGPDYDIEFGLPDPCSTFLSPCEFVISDSARCEDLVGLLARLGWSASCSTIAGNSSVGCASVGCAVANGDVLPLRLVITIDPEASPVYTPTPSASAGLAAAGCAVAGCENVGPGTISGLRCVIDNFLPAHIAYNLVLPE